MKEYIERDALMLRIKEIHCAECDSYHGVRCRACLVDDTLDYIDSEPYADVVPVQNGRWQYNTDFYVWRCSECGENPHKGTGVVVSEENLPAYCPHCGARMDGAE